MDVEKISGTFDYKFNWAEFVITFGALKFLDERRRIGQSDDNVHIHSSIRPVFSGTAPDGDDQTPIHWVYDSEKTIVGNYREAAEAPSLGTLLELTDHVIDAYSAPSLRALLRAPIGHMVLERPADRPACSRTTYQTNTLDQLERTVRVYHEVVSGWHSRLDRS